MQDKQQHLSLQRMINILRTDVVLQADFRQVLTKGVRVFLVIFLTCADHLHLLQDHHVSVLLDQRTNDSPISEILIKVGQPPLLKKHLSHCLLAPKEENVLRVGAEVGIGQVIGRNLRQCGQMLLEVLGCDSCQHVDLEDLVEKGYPRLHGEVVVEPGVYLQE